MPRQSIRLQNYDYSQPGYYHVVIATRNHHHFFGSIVEGTMQLNHPGQIAQDMWLSLAQTFACVELDQHMIMPNHVHGIIVNKEPSLQPNPKIANMPVRFQSYWRDLEQQHYTPGLIPLYEIVRTFKALTTYHVHREGKTPDFSWQSGYYEHIIAHTEQALDTARLYILNNPIQWEIKRRGWEAVGFRWASVPIKHPTR